MKKLLTLFLTLFLIATNAFAEWTAYGLGVNGTVSFYDSSSIKRNGNKVKVWIYYNTDPEDKMAKSLNNFSYRGLDEIDCINETYRTLTLQAFTEPDLRGELKIVNLTDREIDYIAPGTLTATLMKLVCKK
jgi:hypothetical protein